MKPRLYLRILVAAAAFFLTFAAPALARTAIDHGGTYWGDTTVPADQIVHGDVTVLFGDLNVEGQIDGDVTDVGGTIYMAPGSVVTGQKHGLSREYTDAIAPWPSAAAGGDVMAQNFKTIVRLAYNIIIILAFLIFPVRVRMALDRVERHPGLSATAGTLALIAVFPVALLLVISIIGIPLLPLEALAVIAGLLIGQAAVGLLVGRRLYELIRPHTTPSPLAALIVGLLVLSAAETVPVLGGLVLALVWLIGLGAAILAFFHDGIFASPVATTVGGPKAPISGPPMNVA